VKICLPG